jgi:hypothetical protein
MKRKERKAPDPPPGLEDDYQPAALDRQGDCGQKRPQLFVDAGEGFGGDICCFGQREGQPSTADTTRDSK